MMSPEQFYELLLKELSIHKEMQPYYKFLEGGNSEHFRKNYFIQRLTYIYNVIQTQPNAKIWDCGSGYGTTCLFLAMNGISAHGTTLEFYYAMVQKRMEYWKQYGNSSLFTCSYENLFDSPPPPKSYNIILVQDTLHHLEPINDALRIFYQSLKPNGKLIAIEENGKNLIQRAKLYKYRGNNLIISIYDETLQKDILLGNENIRSIEDWEKLFKQQGFTIPPQSIEYIRYYLPIHYRFAQADDLLLREKVIEKKSKIRRNYFFFGLNFLAVKG
ncbi:MAG: class I SAM-dependent methyltransferase [Chitinophagia bacterium]|nr:class I SAM-dependent methyltransferase [Chitinophagia bacterium]